MPSLSTYRKKRDFERTPEPSGDGDAAASEQPRFVVQRHRARRLHYDFRLEMGGVLVSWAIPKGLTLDPSARHLAVHVEDHPLDYIEFEGVIPKGEYGAGDVIVWDRGTWELHAADDPVDAVENGEIHVDLFGSKLRGRFVLVRTRADGAGKEQWLVLHKRDAFADPSWDPEDHPRSVLSGRTNDEVAADPDRLWTRAGEQELRTSTPAFAAPTADELAALAGLPAKGRWSFQGRELTLTNLDTILVPGHDGEDPVTKRDLIRYYACAAPVMLPYLLDRPLNVRRYPSGVDGKGRWERDATVADPPGLAQLANRTAVELHASASRGSDVDLPTYALIAIDPGDDTSWDELLTVARLQRTALDHVRLRGYPKLSGQLGIEVWIPIAAGPTFDETRAWVEQLSQTIGAVVPDLVRSSWEKTLVAPYSVRAAPGAPVSVPIEWDELDDPSLRPDRWTIRTVLDRIEELGDPMAPMLRDAQDLPALT
jgi:bifunctional non-homologous end joining protein LigD